MKKFYQALDVVVIEMGADMIRTSGESSGSGGFTVKEQLFSTDVYD